MHNRKLIITLLGLGLAASAQARCLTAPLTALEALRKGTVGGRAELCLDNGRLRARVQAEGLVRKQVYSAWWVYIDDPSSCLEPHACGPRDLVEPYGGTRQMFSDGSYKGGDLPQAVIGRMASALAFRSERLVLAGEWRRFAPGDESELWLLLMSHGPANRSNASAFARQLLTPEMPELGKPLAGREEDRWRSRWIGVGIFQLRDLIGEDGGAR